MTSGARRLRRFRVRMERGRRANPTRPLRTTFLRRDRRAPGATVVATQRHVWFLQSQRDCVLQPRVARNELPWVTGGELFNPNGVAALRSSAVKHCPAERERPRPQRVREETVSGVAGNPRECEAAAGGDARAPFRKLRLVFLPSRRAATPLGLSNSPAATQGSSFLATLGWRPESRWDSASVFSLNLRTDRALA